MNSTEKTGGSPHSIWKEQEMSIVTFNDNDIAQRANRLDRVVQRRNFLEYFFGGAAAAVLGGIGISELLAGGSGAEMAMSGGLVLLAAGVIFAVLVLFVRSRAPAVTDPALDGLQFHRVRLVRERDMLRSVWLWYVGPTVPGFVLIYGAGFAIPAMSLAFLLVAGGLTAAFLVFIVVLNLRAARRLDREIAALDKNGC